MGMYFLRKKIKSYQNNTIYQTSKNILFYQKRLNLELSIFKNATLSEYFIKPYFCIYLMKVTIAHSISFCIFSMKFVQWILFSYLLLLYLLFRCFILVF